MTSPRSPFSSAGNRRTQSPLVIVALPLLAIALIWAGLSAARQRSVSLERRSPDAVARTRGTGPDATSLPVRSVAQSAVVANPDAPPVRVRLHVEPVSACALQVRGGGTVRSFPAAKVLATFPDLPAGEITVHQKTLTVAGKAYAHAAVEIVPNRSPGVEIDGHLYRGVVRLHRQGTGKFVAVNVVPLEDYVASVVDGEMPASFPAAARAAQAIVARSYVLAQQAAANPDSVHDVYATQKSQKYLGVEYVAADKRRLRGESESSRRAAQETRGLVCTDRGQLFTTYYSAVCGGRTTRGRELFSDAAGPVTTVPCEHCRESPHYRWKKTIPVESLLTAVNGHRQGADAPLKSPLRIRQRTGPGDGKVSSFTLTDGTGSRVVTGAELRQWLPAGVLLSPHFEMTLTGGEVAVSGRGHGHGVGFCQWGARGQALLGRTAREIVQGYYPGAKVEPYASVVRTADRATVPR